MPRNGTRRLLGGVVVAVSLAACAPHSTRDSTPSGPSPFVADWVRQQIAGFEAGEYNRVDGKVLFNGTSLYLIHSPCCDRFNYLYTVEGKPFCAPSGGFAGGGDGKCPPGIGPVPRRVEP